MENRSIPGVNKKYIIVVLILTFVLPLLAAVVEVVLNKHNTTFSAELVGKWFIFSAAGLRLFIAGIKQTTDPAFTVKQIFHIDSPDSYPILRELGFANLCFGLIGIISLFLPQWRVVSAFGSGLYYGLAGVQHLVKNTAGKNEQFALVTDFIISVLLFSYFVAMI